MKNVPLRGKGFKTEKIQFLSYPLPQFYDEAGSKPLLYDN